MSELAIDLNSDLGEGAGRDAEIMPFISSANIACGGHAGDEGTIRETIALAIAHGVAIGAHPGYPDRASFGREAMDMPLQQLVSELVAQIGRVRTAVRERGGVLTHVKAHGALYNRGERDPEIGGAIVAAVQQVEPALLLFAPAGSAMAVAAALGGVRVAREAFADRAYEPDGTLRSRKLAGAVHDNAEIAAAQALSIARDGRVQASDGSFVEIAADTICIHGDEPTAPAVAAAVRAALVGAGIAVRQFGH